MVRPLCVIVPVYKNAELTRHCLNSLLANLAEIAERSPRVVVINDSPDDDAVRAVLSEFDGRRSILLLENEQNVGFVKSTNRGLSLALRDGCDALLVNSDTLTFEGTLRTLLRAAAADEQIGFASPRSNNASLCSLPHFHGGTLASPEEALSRWRTLSATLPEWHFVPTAVGFYMFIAHHVLANHGLLSGEFGVGYEEENDLVMRAGKTGVRAILVNHAFAFHAGAASFSIAGLDLAELRTSNHARMIEAHPHFMPLVRRYEASPHYRAERLMSGLLPDGRGRLRVCFDLTGMGEHHNGTNEHAVGVLKALATRWEDRLSMCGIGTERSFRFHGIDQLPGFRRVDPSAPGLHGVAIRLSQPFDLHHLNSLEVTAPINIFAMLDTIAEDCAPLAASGDFIELWEFVAEHANGLLFNSSFGQQQFGHRHPAARGRPSLAMLLSTQADEYPAASNLNSERSHILVLGNHFAHKASDSAGRRIAAALPSLKVIALGSSDTEVNNLQVIRPGSIDPERLQRLYDEASVVVLPSHVEGFGLGLMHALAACRPIAARNIPATREILACFKGVEGVHLFENDLEMVDAVLRAIASGRSTVGASAGPGWNDWADGLGNLCLTLAGASDTFTRLERRITAGDLLRQVRSVRASDAGPAGWVAEADSTTEDASSRPVAAMTLDELLTLEGRAFVEAAYQSLLQRDADDSGLRFYVAEVESGAGKLAVLEALSASPEGRARAVVLPGLEEAVQRRNAQGMSLARRLLQRVRRGRPR